MLDAFSGCLFAWRKRLHGLRRGECLPMWLTCNPYEYAIAIFRLKPLQNPRGSLKPKMERRWLAAKRLIKQSITGLPRCRRAADAPSVIDFAKVSGSLCLQEHRPFIRLLGANQPIPCPPASRIKTVCAGETEQSPTAISTKTARRRRRFCRANRCVARRRRKAGE